MVTATFRLFVLPSDAPLWWQPEYSRDNWLKKSKTSPVLSWTSVVFRAGAVALGLKCPWSQSSKRLRLNTWSMSSLQCCSCQQHGGLHLSPRAPKPFSACRHCRPALVASLSLPDGEWVCNLSHQSGWQSQKLATPSSQWNISKTAKVTQNIRHLKPLSSTGHHWFGTLVAAPYWWYPVLKVVSGRPAQDTS